MVREGTTFALDSPGMKSYFIITLYVIGIPMHVVVFMTQVWVRNADSRIFLLFSLNKHGMKSSERGHILMMIFSVRFK